MKKSSRQIFDPTLVLLRLVSNRIVKFLARTSVTSVQVTILNFLLFVPPMVFLLVRGTHTDLLIVLVLLVLYSLFDLVDGELARQTNTSSPLGKWLDPSIDTVLHILVMFSISFHVIFVSNFPYKALVFLPLFGQMIAHIFGLQMAQEFKLDPFSGNKNLEALFKSRKKISFVDLFLRNMLVPTNIFFMLFFTFRAYFLAGALFNILPWTFIIFGFFIMLRAFCLYMILAFHYSGNYKNRFLIFQYLSSINK